MLSPPEPLNFARHLFKANRGRGTRIAYVDDLGSVTYGELDARARRFAAALVALGVRREERVLLLMLDTVEWPIAFLGALYAGVVPVAVNTLLTADDYAFMLANSRAQAAIVSAALAPTLAQALGRAGHEVRHTIVAGEGSGEALPGAIPFATLLAAHEPLSEPAPTCGDDPAFWLYSSGSTGKPKGTVHTHANAWWTAELYGKGVLALREDDVCFSGFSMGRPVLRSTPFAQFTVTNGSAASSSPVFRSSMYAKPLRSKFASTFLGWPLMLMSTSTISLMPS